MLGLTGQVAIEGRLQVLSETVSKNKVKGNGGRQQEEDTSLDTITSVV